MQWLRLDEREHLKALPQARNHLESLGQQSALNLIAIFGSARQGKSFLMNQLAGPDGCGFKVSNKQDPCTVGVDLASKIMTLSDFSAVGTGNGRPTVQGRTGRMLVGFVDAEGQGDRDTAYDAHIACPVLLSSKCVLFNWRDSLQKDRILDLLGVMCRAARTVDVDQVKGKRGVPFGHLHIVFRDWNYDGDVQSVERQLFTHESNATEDGVRRNRVRDELVQAFESITVWLLPPPTEKTSDLRKVLKDSMLSEEFKASVYDLRRTLCHQLGEPRKWASQVLTGPKLAKLIPLVAETLNRGEIVLPRSAYDSMMRAELEKLSRDFKEMVSKEFKQATEGARSEDVDLEKFKIHLAELLHSSFATFDRDTDDLALEPSLLNEEKKALTTFAMDQMNDIIARFGTEKWKELTVATVSDFKQALVSLESELPLPEEQIEARIRELAHSRRAHLDEFVERNDFIAQIELEDAVERITEICDHAMQRMLALNVEMQVAKEEQIVEIRDLALKAVTQHMDKIASESSWGCLSEDTVQSLLEELFEQFESQAREVHADVSSSSGSHKEHLRTEVMLHHDHIVKRARSDAKKHVQDWKHDEERELSNLMTTLLGQAQSRDVPLTRVLRQLDDHKARLESTCSGLKQSMQDGHLANADKLTAWVEYEFEEAITNARSMLKSEREKVDALQREKEISEAKWKLEQQRKQRVEAEAQRRVELEARQREAEEARQREAEQEEREALRQMAKREALRLAQQEAERKAYEQAEAQARAQAEEMARIQAEMEEETQRADNIAEEREAARAAQMERAKKRRRAATPDSPERKAIKVADPESEEEDGDAPQMSAGSLAALKEEQRQKQLARATKMHPDSGKRRKSTRRK